MQTIISNHSKHEKCCVRKNIFSRQYWFVFWLQPHSTISKKKPHLIWNKSLLIFFASLSPSTQSQPSVHRKTECINQSFILSFFLSLSVSSFGFCFLMFSSQHFFEWIEKHTQKFEIEIGIELELNLKWCSHKTTVIFNLKSKWIRLSLWMRLWTLLRVKIVLMQKAYNKYSIYIFFDRRLSQSEWRWW
jgi:hypothetical protein